MGTDGALSILGRVAHPWLCSSFDVASGYRIPLHCKGAVREFVVARAVSSACTSMVCCFGRCSIIAKQGSGVRSLT